MTSDRWQEIERMYHAALERDAVERAQYLKQACAGDDALRQEVESLLSNGKTTDGWLEGEALKELAGELFGKQNGRSLTGTQLGPYQVLSLIGAGGMGEVYEARDSKLARNVAIKVLPAAFVHDPERLARFQREARVLASLNHPNIATIHGIEESDGTHYLVMELVPGETLAERINKGALPVEEALKIAGQIAGGLEAAHEKGIIHRDLKPANVKVTPEGKVKVLDFGLAKAFAGDSADSNPSQSPTLSAVATMQGVLLGTAAYMSPEQARGKTVDKRTDIWAFGCVLYELLTGKQAFHGEDITEILAAVVRSEPDWQVLPSTTPIKTYDLLRRCLQKDALRRLRDIGDARLEMEETLTAAIQLKPTHKPVVPIWTIGLTALAFMALLTTAVVLWFHTAAPAAEAVHFTFTAQPREILPGVRHGLAASPDGRQLAFVTDGSSGEPTLWVRLLDSSTPRQLAGTEGASGPFWSPDGHFIGFFAQGKLKKVDVSGGPVQNICTIRADLGASWGAGGAIVLSPENRAPLYRVPAAGGTPDPVTSLDTTRRQNSHRWPSFLPDGRHFLFTARSDVKENTGIFVGSLDSKENKWLLAAQSSALYAPPGYLLFIRDNTLMAQPFSAKSLELSGEPLALVGDVDQSTTSAFGAFSASLGGTLLTYVSSIPNIAQLGWFDRKGTRLGSIGPAQTFLESIRLSSDGKRLAIVRPDPESGNRDIWLMDMSNGGQTRLTSHPANDWWPVWSPDGTQIAFASDRKGTSSIYRKATNGSGEEELLLESGTSDGRFPTDWSEDGRSLAFEEDTSKTRDNLWVLPLFGDRKLYPIAQTEFDELSATFSPDGKWIAYASDESGAYEVYVKPVSKSGKQRVSTAGGVLPRWRRDGRELFFVSGEKLVSVATTLGESFQAGPPATLFSPCVAPGTLPYLYPYDVSPDGTRFLLRCPVAQTTPAQINVALNWSENLKRRVPPGK